MNNEQNTLIISQKDFETISILITTNSSSAAELLENELDRATVVQNGDLPKDVVAINSLVKFEDLDNHKELLVKLVLPNEANIEENKISILAPVGSALIGLRVGQTIKWPVPGGKDKNLKVISVSKSPEN